MATMTMTGKSAQTGRTLAAFREEIERSLFQHQVIVNNPYTKWFKQGLADENQVKDLILQFSVFSNHFLVVQAKRLVNAATEEGERAARHILVNECGVGLDPRSGSADGRTFSSANAHINWLRQIGAMLDLNPRRLGRWEEGGAATHEFLQGLDETYGSRDNNIGAGASFAIESWAAFGIGQGPEAEANNFWEELIVGLDGFNRRRREPLGLPPLSKSFFEYHFQLESGHGAGVWHELEQTFQEPDFDAEAYLKGAKKALDSILRFWTGLDEARSAARPIV